MLNHPQFRLLLCLFIFPLVSFTEHGNKNTQSWVRINLLGYQPASSKVAVWASKSGEAPTRF
jgi:endoglucanase